MSYSVVCCNNLLTPYNPFVPSNSWNCCNLLVPYLPSFSGGGANTCSEIDCSSYTPVCFSVSGKNLCNYLAGIDQSICSLQTAQSNITCSQITMTGTYNCIFPLGSVDTGMNLCAWAAQVNLDFCGIYATLQSLTSTGFPSAGVMPQNVVNNNLLVDGANGSLTTTTGLSATHGALSTTSSNTHGTASNNVMVTSSDPINSAILNTDSNIAVAAHKTYELKAFVYVGAGAPPASMTGITINGTGTQRQIQQVNSATQAGWQQIVTQYTPNVNQNITISIGGTGFTSGVLAYADLTMQPIPAINSGGYYEFQLPYINDISETYNNIASNFAVSLSYSTSGLGIIVGMDVLVLNGKTIFTTQQSLTLTANTTTYVYYDTWTDSYIQKATNVTDATQVLIYTLVTNSSVVTSKTVDVLSAPYSGNNIQALSITGANIANSTITASKLTNSSVSAATYGDGTHVPQFAVNAQGIITSASNVAIIYPIISVNGKTGAASLGLGDINNVVLTSPLTGQYLTYNGTNWVNSASVVSFYQIMYANGSAKTQRGYLNFSTSFALTDVSVSNWTLVQIANNGISYGMLQQSTGTNVLLGNSTGSAGNYSEQGVNKSLLLSGGFLSVNNVANVQTIASYNLTVADCNGQTVVGFTYPATGATSAVLPVASSVVDGAIVRIKDLSGNAGTHNITVTVTGGANIDGSATAVISSNYGKADFVKATVSAVAGWYSI